MSQKIYLVEGKYDYEDQGEGSSEEYWTVTAYTSKEQADLHCSRCEAAKDDYILAQQGDHPSTVEVLREAWSEVDPNVNLDVIGELAPAEYCSYFVHSTNLHRHFDEFLGAPS